VRSTRELQRRIGIRLQSFEDVSEGRLVDLREHSERIDDGTIPGSLHVPRGMLEFAADPTHPLHVAELQPDRRTILYCAGGSRSALGVVTLHELGYRNVATE
jgi:rhodanese-related sulfurtransferase